MLVRNVNDQAVETFLRKYPKVRQIMVTLIKKNSDLLKGYKAFLKFKDKEEGYLGGKAETVTSPTFGEKTYYRYDWSGVGGNWPEVYQYLWGQNQSINETEMKITREQLREMVRKEVRKINEVAAKTPAEKIRNYGLRIDKLKKSIATTKSPAQKTRLQDRLKTVLQHLSNLKKNMGIKRPA